VKLGLLLWNQDSTWSEVVEAAQRADRLGYDSVWMWDHLYSIAGDGIDPYRPIFEGWTSISALAALTERVRLGLLVGANGFRNPGLVAKMAVTLDHISNGRAIVGLGAGWFELEHTAHGIPFGASVGERLGWLDDSVAIIRGLLDGESVTRRSAHYDVVSARHAPRPIQAHLPILVGGNGLTRTLRTVATRADMSFFASTVWRSAAIKRRSSGPWSSNPSFAMIRPRPFAFGRIASLGRALCRTPSATLGWAVLPTSRPDSGHTARWASTR